MIKIMKMSKITKCILLKNQNWMLIRKIKELLSVAVVSSDGAVVASVLWIVVVGLVVGSAVVAVNNKFSHSKL